MKETIYTFSTDWLLLSPLKKLPVIIAFNWCYSRYLILVQFLLFFFKFQIFHRLYQKTLKNAANQNQQPRIFFLSARKRQLALLVIVFCPCPCHLSQSMLICQDIDPNPNPTPTSCNSQRNPKEFPKYSKKILKIFSK